MTISGTRILVIDDERAIRRFLRTALSAQGYQLMEVSSGEEGLMAVKQFLPDVVILDLGLPGIDGIEVTRCLRKWTQIPIIILSVQHREQDKILALDSGADDYLTKPFSVNELLARIRVVLRRYLGIEDLAVFEIGDLEVNLTNRLVTVEKKPIQLTPTEYEILHVLVTHAGRVLTHSQLLDYIRGTSASADAHVIRVHMSNLRRKLEKDPSRPQWIITEPGVGYRLRSSN